MPLQMRLPKIGFKNPNRVEFVVFNLGQLQAMAEKYGVSDINIGLLLEKGYTRKRDKVKVLGSGELSAKLSVSVHAVSGSAKSVIEGLGGTVNLV